MEFPDLGKHCSEPSCKQLDYLPLKCDACQSIFCREHISYNNHNCPSSYKKNVQVPVCPLCNIPIPVKRGDPPDIAVGAHIDSDCQSDPAKKRRKIFINKCSAKGCKGKEIIPVTCNECKMNFCLKHRHPTDHQCEGKGGAARRRAAEAAMARHVKAKGTGAPSSSSNQSPTSKNSAVAVQSRSRSIQGSLSEDEALARALALSLQDPSQQNGHAGSVEEQVDTDHMLAQAIAESERLQRAGGNTPSSQNRCCVS